MESFANSLIEKGLSVIPIRMPEKEPTVKWKQYQTRLPNPGELIYNDSFGLVCGKGSGGLEVIDIDAKNDPTLLERFDKAIEDHCPGALDNLTIQKTINNGIHLVYRCPVIEGNKKLAKKPNHEVLIETRGEGGYIVIAPTNGYSVVNGSFENIQTISIDDRNKLLEACRSLNEYFEPVIQPKQNISSTGVTPWDDYNQRADIPSLLESYSWKFVRSMGESQLWRRPGKDVGHSASWNGQTFYCFTSSTGLEPGKAYSPSALYTHLEHNGNFTEANSKLYSLGYGERSTPQTTNTPQNKIERPEGFKLYTDYIIREEPTEEIGIISINGVNVLSIGNVLLLTGPMKGRKTMLASILVNQSGLKTAYIGSAEKLKSV